MLAGGAALAQALELGGKEGLGTRSGFKLWWRKGRRRLLGKPEPSPRGGSHRRRDLVSKQEGTLRPRRASWTQRKERVAPIARPAVRQEAVPGAGGREVPRVSGSLML